MNFFKWGIYAPLRGKLLTEPPLRRCQQDLVAAAAGGGHHPAIGAGCKGHLLGIIDGQEIGGGQQFETLLLQKSLHRGKSYTGASTQSKPRCADTADHITNLNSS